MKKRNLYLLLTSLLLAPTVFFTLPHQTGQTQEPESPGAIFTVTNNLNAGAGSFRQAIIDANTAAGLDTIRFQIGTGPVEISHNAALPDITQPVIIDGTTQPGFGGTPLIRLAGNFTVGVKITGGGSTVKALAISGFQNGVVLENAGGNIVTGNFIGICPQNPTAGCGNFGKGVVINNSPNNRIGGATAAERNIISGNQDNGVAITGASSSGNLIIGNYIGLRLDGTLAPNDNFGVAIIGAPNNRIGGSLAGERNVISGNAGLCNLPPIANNSDVFISGAAATGNTVEGNYIGTTINGMDADSPCVGVRIDNAPNNTIGGTVGTTPGGACTGACNLISGYGGIGNQSGVTIAGSGSTGNSVLGNFIGTNPAGTARLDNDVSITITNGASNNTVGGTTAAGRNLINNGLWLSAGAATNTLQGNYIGTDTTGNTGIGFIASGLVTAALTIENSPNNRIGMAAGTTLGGACTGGCNLISGNNSTGVEIKGSGSTGNRVDYNYIGLNAAGTAALRNLGGAMSLLNGANNNTIGRPLTTTPFQAKDECAEGGPNVVCVQDDTGRSWIRFNLSTGEYTWELCRTQPRLTGSGTGEIVLQPPDLAGLRVTGRIGVAVPLSLAGHAIAEIRGLPMGGGADIIDSDIDNSTCNCPPDDGQYVSVGVMRISGTNTNGNMVNQGLINFLPNGLTNVANPGENILIDQNASSNRVQSVETGTNDVPAVDINSGVGNELEIFYATWLRFGQVSSSRGQANPGLVIDLNGNGSQDPNDPGDVDAGANNTQNYPIFLLKREANGSIRALGSFPCEQGTTLRISLYGINDFVRSGQTFERALRLGTKFNVTESVGQCNINRLFTGVDAFAIRNQQRISATATKVPPTPIANPDTALVGVNGDTSEFSLPAAVPQPRFDRDEDGKTDFIVYRPGASANAFSFWYVLKSSDFTFQAVQFGNGEDVPVAGDWQGDGVMDLAVWRPSSATWYYSRISGNPTTNYESIPWGSPTDKPVVGDFDGDGANDAAIFRPANGTWWIRNSLGGSTFVQAWGLGSDKLVPADYDGDGDTDIAVYRNGTWYISVCPSCPVRYEQFGLASDVPVPGDYDGDGRADIAVWRPSDGIWYINQSTAGFTANRFGLPTDKALNGDFDADGKNDLAVWRPSDGIFYVLRSEQGFTAVRWGLSTDVPVSMFPNQ